MRPFVVILGIILGTLVAIAFGLVTVLFIFWLLQDENPRFSAELVPLVQSSVIFTVLAATAAVGFLATLRGEPWRYAVLALLWVGLGLTGWLYWPD